MDTPNLFQHNFADDYRLMDLADATLKTEDGNFFKVHKIILAKKYKYFTALFCNKVKDESSFLIPCLKGKTLSSILTYIYTGKIDISDHNIAELVIASDYLMMDDLLSEVSMFIKRNLSVDNCFRIFTAAHLINREDMLKDFFRFVQMHFETVVYNWNTGFEELPLDIFKLFLGDKNLCISSEETVFLAIRKWVNADSSNRLSLVPELIMYLAMTEVDDSLATEILKDDIITNNPHCKDLIHKPNDNSVESLRSYVKKRPKPFKEFQNKRLTSRLNFIFHYSVVDGTHAIQVYVTYDEKIDFWRKVFSISIVAEEVVCVNDCICIFNSHDERNLCYNISEKQWHDFEDFMIPRYNYSVIVCEGSLYVLGGSRLFTEDEIYDVEIYDFMNNRWYIIEPMFPVTSFASVGYRNSIYVVGYKITHAFYEMIAQVYDSASETWSILPAVSINRSHFAIVTYREKIYVIGGTGLADNVYLKDVEVFDPVTNEWKIEASIPYTYYSPSAIVLDDLLFVYDNHMEDREYRKTNPPVNWNTEKACWEKLEKSSKLYNLHLYKFLTLENLDCISIIVKENRQESFEKSPFN